MERDLAIVISMSCSIINSGNLKPLPASICNEALPIRISLAKLFKGVPALENVACRNVEIEVSEDIYICKVGGITGVGIRIVWRDVVGL